MAEENKNVIVSRIQHRHGLKQDLPQPLRPGEIGLATDSRQVYIGGDPDDPQSAQYNAITYFENTVSARDHTLSILENQMLIFQLPYVKYGRGEWNGIGMSKSWNPTDSRSIINGTAYKQCKYTSSDYPIFSVSTTESVSLAVSTISINNLVVTVPYDSRVRIGDSITGTNVTTELYVADITNAGSEMNIVMTIAQDNILIGDVLTFGPQVGLNFSSYYELPLTTNDGYKTKFKQGSFKSDDVSVFKNGIKITPERNDNLLGVPSATAEYTLNCSDVSNDGTMTLTMRVAPTIYDDISLCFYSESQVQQAIKGVERVVNGQTKRYISTSSDIESFYEAYDIPWYREIPTNLILAAETSGLGFIGLQKKHIDSVADGKRLLTTEGLSFGSFRVSRNDQLVVGDIDIADPTGTSEGIIVDITISNPNLDVFETQDTISTYKYDHVKFVGDTVNFFTTKVFPIDAAPGNNISIIVPHQTAEITREVVPTYNGNNSITLTGNAVGVQVGDWIRLIGKNNASMELHDQVFQVLSKTDNTIDIAATLTSPVSSCYYINHGNENSTNHVQIYSPNHTLTVAETEVIFTSSTSSIVNVISSPVTKGIVREIQSVNRTHVDTYFIAPDSVVADDLVIGASAEYLPSLETSYTGMVMNPILSINLSNKTTVQEAIAVISKPMVRINGVDPLNDIQIFTLLDWLPQEDGKMNAVYFTSKSAYSSVDSGGLEFTLYNDALNTVETLGLTAGVYNRTNNSIRAKLEKWLNDLSQSRRCNLFSAIFIAGQDTYYDFGGQHNFGTYTPVIDDTYREMLFCDRKEAAQFGKIVNTLYAESAYDRAQDDLQGTRGLINLKNNLEIQTREASSQGEKIISYTSMERDDITITDNDTTAIMEFDISVFNSYIVDYTMVESPGSTNKYNRIGTLHISARSDFTSETNGVVAIKDDFASVAEMANPADPVIEPKFNAHIDDSGMVVITLADQPADPNNPNLSQTVLHSLNTDLQIKYVLRRWTSNT